MKEFKQNSSTKRSTRSYASASMASLTDTYNTWLAEGRGPLLREEDAGRGGRVLLRRHCTEDVQNTREHFSEDPLHRPREFFLPFRHA